MHIRRIAIVIIINTIVVTIGGEDHEQRKHYDRQRHE